METGQAQATQETDQAQENAAAGLLLGLLTEPGRGPPRYSPGDTSARETPRLNLSKPWMPSRQPVVSNPRCSWIFVFGALCGPRAFKDRRSRSCWGLPATGG